MNFQLLKTFTFLLAFGFLITSCTEEADLQTTTIEYKFHNGQTVATAPYGGYHDSNLSASMKIDELESGSTKITVELSNTMDGETYHMHAHDSADPATTPNGTPYNESPNSDIFAQMLVGNGSTTSISQETTMSYEEIVNTYEGFFVIHDPLQAVNTADITSYVVVAGFAKAQTNTTYKSSTFSYDFNTGQVAAAFAYNGTHADNFNSTIRIDELADGRSRVAIVHNNTMDGMMYNTHAHDMADPSTTPNSTPYIEAPNGGIFAAAIMGNGGTAGKANISDSSYDEITANYDGFFVVHDPLQDITTIDPTTYIMLGVFAR